MHGSVCKIRLLHARTKIRAWFLNVTVTGASNSPHFHITTARIRLLQNSATARTDAERGIWGRDRGRKRGRGGEGGGGPGGVGEG
jgi:hypothetical protein